MNDAPVNPTPGPAKAETAPNAAGANPLPEPPSTAESTAASPLEALLPTVQPASGGEPPQPPASPVAQIARTMGVASGALAGGTAVLLAIWVAMSASGLLTRDVVSVQVTERTLNEGLIYALPRRDVSISLTWELTTCELRDPMRQQSPPRIGLTLSAALDSTLTGDPNATYRFVPPRHWLPLSELALQVEYLPGSMILKSLGFNMIDRSSNVISAAREVVQNLGGIGAAQAIVEPNTPVAGGGPAIPADVAACSQRRIDIIKRLASLRADLASVNMDEAAISNTKREIARLVDLVSIRRRIPIAWGRETRVTLTLAEAEGFFEPNALQAQIVAGDDLMKLITDSAALIAVAAPGETGASAGSPNQGQQSFNGIVYRLPAERDVAICRVSCTPHQDGSVPGLIYRAKVSVPQFGGLGVIRVQSELLSSRRSNLCFAGDGALAKVGMTSQPPGSRESAPAGICSP